MVFIKTHIGLYVPIGSYTQKIIFTVVYYIYYNILGCNLKFLGGVYIGVLHNKKIISLVMHFNFNHNSFIIYILSHLSYILST